jgi:hypothetical protein
MHGRGRTNVAPAHEALRRKFEALADPDGSLTPEVRARRASMLRSAHMLEMSSKAAEGRRNRKAPPAIGTPGGAAPGEGTTNARRPACSVAARWAAWMRSGSARRLMRRGYRGLNKVAEAPTGVPDGDPKLRRPTFTNGTDGRPLRKPCTKRFRLSTARRSAAGHRSRFPPTVR